MEEMAKNVSEGKKPTARGGKKNAKSNHSVWMCGL
jgi:hypothetical protein